MRWTWVKQCLLYITGLHWWSPKCCGCLHKIKWVSVVAQIGRDLQAQPLAKKLLTVDYFWESETSFPLRVWSLASWPSSSWWSHTHDYGGSWNWTKWVIFSKDEIKCGWVGENLGGVNGGVGSECDQNTFFMCIKFSNNKMYF